MVPNIYTLTLGLFIPLEDGGNAFGLVAHAQPVKARWRQLREVRKVFGRHPHVDGRRAGRVCRIVSCAAGCGVGRDAWEGLLFRAVADWRRTHPPRTALAEAL